MSDRPIRPFVPELWADSILKEFQRSSNMLQPARLSGQDVWAPAGDYSEAVMWANLLSITVYKIVDLDNRVENFRLVRQGYPSIHIEACSPEELVKALRRFAAGLTP